jgi:hypothetical protein
MTRRAGAAIALAAMGLSACSGLAPDPKAEAVAKAAYQRLVAKDDAGLEAMLAPGSRKPTDAKTFAMIRTMAPDGPAPAPTTVNWQAYAGTSARTITYQHAYAYADRTVTMTSVLVPAGGPQGWQLRSFNVNTTFGAPAK